MANHMDPISSPPVDPSAPPRRNNPTDSTPPLMGPMANAVGTLLVTIAAAAGLTVAGL